MTKTLVERLRAEVDRLAEKNLELFRWKSTNAPRLEALQGLLDHERKVAADRYEAAVSIDSERQANAILTEEVQRLRHLLDTRPAMNAGLTEAYVEWTASVYASDMVAARTSANDAAMKEQKT